ncbi:hypothetical protein [Kribbella sp. CA-293567]|uniref:hypothetical protein n=1 Tax=Kribbella sp. CA-293567 TaxID=3002436 RepID=UPI0022DDB7DC|nr:hypothetical protein [Kribbella sp. CA-293567]WBQ04362.1 hypothetical protein OX958_30900 [Kribbella sp. CA-293567]
MAGTASATVSGVYDADQRQCTLTVSLTASGTTVHIAFGEAGDRPVAGDWNGDGSDDIGVYRTADANFDLRLPDGKVQAINYGDSDWCPMVGDGREEPAVVNSDVPRFIPSQPDRCS